MWIETVQAGWNKIVDNDENLILEMAENHLWASDQINYFGNGDASTKVVKLISNWGTE
jgi:UDP-N-acetylglucosamine 2-epimerase